ncbi:MAG TPA: CDP-alcohol phosphatidyltransferase family protein [Chloroflexota bacterium]|jgi:CDP-diacylglycerol--glycerol-3-phosphate 3-phosphatidyltransferase|nr:CDP-alcohol phosphatidyltransferase family protein [Chloroflexota bacterium]
MIPPELQAVFRHLVERMMQPLVRFGITPNMVTIVGLLLSGVTALVLAGGQFVAGGLLVLFSGAFDMLDGGLARASGGGSKFGAFFDSTLDRLSEGVIYLGLLYWFTVTQRPLLAVLIYLVVLGSLLISYSRARAEGLGLECKVGLLARPERVILLGLALVVDGAGLAALPKDQILVDALAGLAILTFFTLAQRIWYIWRLTVPAAAPRVGSAWALFLARRDARRARHP